MPSFVPTADSIRRIVQTILSVPSSRSSSSRRVPERWTSIDGKDPLLGELPIEDELAVARPLELLVDHVVHARAGIHEARGDDRERATLLDVPGGAEEALRRIKGDRVDAAGKCSSGRRQCEVVGAREARHRVEQDDDVAAGLDLALGDLECHLGDVRVVLGRLVERRADDLALHGTAHVRDFLRPLADERDHEEHVRVVGSDAVRDVLEQDRLAGLRRADDEGALPLADRVDEVDQTLREVLRDRSRG